MVMMRGSREGESQEESGCPKYFQHTTGPLEPVKGGEGEQGDPSDFAETLGPRGATADFCRYQINFM